MSLFIRNAYCLGMMWCHAVNSLYNGERKIYLNCHFTILVLCILDYLQNLFKQSEDYKNILNLVQIKDFK